MPRQVKETESFHLAIMAKLDDETQEHVMALLPTVEHSGSTRMRTLGFIGPFLAQYEAAQVDAKFGSSTLPGNACLPHATCPFACPGAQPRALMPAHGHNAPAAQV